MERPASRRTHRGRRGSVGSGRDARGAGTRRRRARLPVAGAARHQLQIATGALLLAGFVSGALVARFNHLPVALTVIAATAFLVAIMVLAVIHVIVAGHMVERRQWAWLFLGGPFLYLYVGPWDAPARRSKRRPPPEPVGYAHWMNELEDSIGRRKK